MSLTPSEILNFNDAATTAGDNDKFSQNQRTIGAALRK
jgi:hypothetical protein